MRSQCCFHVLTGLAMGCLLTGMVIPAQAEESLRAQSIVNFTFDEEHGPAIDSATVGQANDQGALVNEPHRIASPFWNQSGKRALILDAAKQQYLQIADSPDVSRPNALTFSFLFVNRHDPNDGAFHGLIAKRGTIDGKVFTNYGINFQQQSDTLQVYLSDGSGYKVVQFSTQAVIPVFKRTFLAVTYQVADAPGSDADTDADDVRIQVFANGEPVKPKSVSNGFVDGNDGWITDISPAGLANSLPLTIGRSDENGEYTTGVIDEFSLFPTVLTGEQIQQLFREVAGADVREQIAQDGPAPSLTPVISALSQPAVQIGQTTTLTISGNNLGPEPHVIFPLSDVKFETTSAESNRLVLQVTPDHRAIPGRYPLWIKTSQGISRMVPMAIDHLVQLPIPSSGPEAPQSIPAAYYGNLSGSVQPKIYLEGKKGQRLVADVELKRLGGQANPVIEIKTVQGTPVEIAWGHHALQGDARAECVLPHDGVYAVELHDLTYNAPGQSAFRVKVGDLRILDAIFPPVAPAGAIFAHPMGAGFQPNEQWIAQVRSLSDTRFGILSLPENVPVDGVIPPIQISTVQDVIESRTPPEEGQLQAVTISWTEPSMLPIGINGRLQSAGEQDRYLLNVTPGQKLKFTLQTHSLTSSVEGEIALYQPPQGNVLALSGEQPTLSDTVLEYTVPAEQTQLVVGIRDILNRRDERSFYRLEISPGGRPNFDLLLNAPVVNLPENGSHVLELQVTRAGYDGPIAWKVVGETGISVSPSEIPAGVTGKTLIRLSRQGRASAGTLPLIQLIGESVGLEPAISSVVRITTGVSVPVYAETLAVGTPPELGLSLESAPIPAVLFRGVETEVPVSVQRSPNPLAADKPIRFTLLTTEAPRRRNPNDSNAGNFPMVHLVATTPLESSSNQRMLKVLAPLEVSETSLDLVLQADALAHLYADRSVATAFSSPQRVQIQAAVAPKVDEPTLAIRTEGEHHLTGQLQRSPGFNGVVEVAILGLPKEYQLTPAVVPGDQGTFSITLKGPKVTQEMALENVKLRVTSRGALLLADQPLAVKAIP